MVSNEEFMVIQKLTEAIFPGANEARAHEFIRRDMESNPVLVGMYREGLKQLEAGAQQMYRLTLLQLNENQLNQLLTRYEKTPFFTFLRNHTLEGIFSDPIYGGNYEAYGWRLIGFAGPRFYPPETLDKTKHPTVYYDLGGIAYEEKS